MLIKLGVHRTMYLQKDLMIITLKKENAENGKWERLVGVNARKRLAERLVLMLKRRRVENARGVKWAKKIG